MRTWREHVDEVFDIYTKEHIDENWRDKTKYVLHQIIEKELDRVQGIPED